MKELPLEGVVTAADCNNAGAFGDPRRCPLAVSLWRMGYTGVVVWFDGIETDQGDFHTPKKAHVAIERAYYLADGLPDYRPEAHNQSFVLKPKT